MQFRIILFILFTLASDSECMHEMKGMWNCMKVANVSKILRILKIDGRFH